MRVYFIRHGESEENVKGTGTFMLDPKLTERGRRQIQVTGHRLLHLLDGQSVDFLISSTYLRARQSAEILADTLWMKEILFSSLVLERRHPSAIVGKQNGSPEVMRIFEEMYSDRYDRFVYADEESFYDFRERLKKIITFLDDLRVRGLKTVVIVSHATTIRGVAAYMASWNGELRYDTFSSWVMNVGLKNGSITTCEWKPNWNGSYSWHLVTLNDQAYLERIK